MIKFRTLASDAGFFGLISMGQKVISLSIVPAYLHLMTQAEYGKLDVLILLGSIVVVLSELQLTSGIARFYYSVDDRAVKRRLLYRSVIFRIGTASVLFVLLLLLLRIGIVPDEIRGVLASSNTVMSVGLYAVSILLFDVVVLKQRLDREKASFAILSVGSALLTAATAVGLLYFFNIGAAGVLYAMASSNVICTAIIAGQDSVHGCMSYDDSDVIRQVMAYSLPLVPGSIFAFVGAHVGKLYVLEYMSLSDVAVLALATKMGLIITMFAGAYRLAWEPLAMGKYYEESPLVDKTAFYRVSLSAFLIIGIVILFVSSAAVDNVVALIAPDGYMDAGLYFVLIAATYFVVEAESLFRLGIQLSSRTWVISILSVQYMITCLVGWHLFVPVHGVVGMAVVMLVSSMIRLVATVAVAQRFYRINYGYGALFVVPVSVLMVILLRYGKHAQMLGELQYVAWSVVGMTAAVMMAMSSELYSVMTGYIARRW